MKTPSILAERIAATIIPSVAGKRPPDFVIGADADGGPYLRRWYLSPWRGLQGRLRDRAKAKPTRANRAAAYLFGLLPNLYLHEFLRDDDDRALHDHPSWAVSYMLRGAYIEHTIANGGIHWRQTHRAGALRFMGTRHSHRIELFNDILRGIVIICKGTSVSSAIAPGFKINHQDGFQLSGFDLIVNGQKKHMPRKPCWTIFLFGPTVRDWGFHCPQRGWVHWREFTAADKPGEVGRGCG